MSSIYIWDREFNPMYNGRVYPVVVAIHELSSDIQIDPKFVKELRRKYGLAKLQKNKTEMSNLERQLKYYAN